MTARCPDCPIAGRCVQEWTGHRPFCDWAKRGGAYLARVQDLSAAGPPEPTSTPSLVAMAGSALAAAGRFVASGFAVVDQAEYDRRRGICETCEHLDRVADRCRKCACFLAIKPWSKAEHCPIAKW